MKVNIISLKKMNASLLSDTSAQAFLFTELAKDVFPESANEEDSFWQDGEITVEGAVTNKGQTLEATGVIKAAIKCSCNLCLAETSVKMDIPFCQEYQEKESGGRFFDEAEADEAELIYFSGDEIDLKPLVREGLLLAQPLRQICREECRGLCPDCGENLNITDCSCADKKIDARMSVLEKLLKNDKDS